MLTHACIDIFHPVLILPYGILGTRTHPNTTMTLFSVEEKHKYIEKPWPRHSRLGMVGAGFLLEVRLCLKDELESARQSARKVIPGRERPRC